jgi:hypothetical protein
LLLANFITMDKFPLPTSADLSTCYQQLHSLLASIIF